MKTTVELCIIWTLCVLSVGLAAPRLQSEAFPPLSDPVGFAGPFVGVHGDALLVAGGANFPDRPPWEGGKKVWQDRVHVMTRGGDSAWEWRTVGQRLPHPLAYGVSVTTPQGIVCAGGCDSDRSYAKAFRIRWHAGSG